MNNWPNIYFKSRSSFIAATRASDVEVAEYATSEFGRASTAVATLGDKNARNVLVVTSGVHGVEIGAADIQTEFLLTAQELMPSVRVVLVHDLNPEGTILGLRTNKDGIDLNRNFMPDFQKLPPNPGYDKLSSAFIPQSLGRIQNLIAWSRMYGSVVKSRSTKPFIDAMTRGQYDHPDGLYYGGREPAKEHLNWITIAYNHLRNAETIIHLDLHSGLGKRGCPTLMPANDLEPGINETIQNIWRNETIFQHDSLSIANRISGDIVDFWKHPNMPKAPKIIPVAVEFGTVEPMQVMKAMRDRLILYCRHKDDHPKADRVFKAMEDAFSPTDSIWRGLVAVRGEKILRNAIEYLSAQPR